MPTLDTLLKDPALAPEGLRKIDFAASRMPVLAAVAGERVARRKLAALGIRCDELTATQEDYLRGWRLGT